MNFNQKLENILKENEKFCDNNGELLKQKVKSYALKFDEDLIEALLDDTDSRDHFFKKISDATIFDYRKFIDFMDDKNFLLDSYTKFSNKVGLTISNKHIKQIDDVVLTFPFKDCVLEGGQSKEDENRKEIFFNETLAKDEINRLFDKKVITNATKYYYSESTHEVIETKDVKFTRNKDGVITDNLIIKGNNLLALHTLKSNFAGKVKLIYIDPPYNTGSDSFGYNDSFNHSTWLTFMKNRLDASIKLLHPTNGLIAVQCSFHQYAYLKVLMDDIFSIKSHKCTFNIQVRHPDRILTGDKEFNDVVEYILFYSVNKDYKFPKKEELKTVDNYIYEIQIDDEPEILICGSKEVEIYTPDKYTVNTISANECGLKTISVRGSIREKNSSGRFYVKYLEELKSEYPALTLFKVPNMGDDMFGFRYFHLPREGNKNGSYYQGKPMSSDITYKPYANFYNYESEYNSVAEEGDVDFRNGKKPEELIKFIIELFTNENDIVFDYHLGSGTTATVSHKINRQYVGIEQMDYIEDISVERIKKVINGEQGGISEIVNWKDGGEFIYLELDKYNQKFIDDLSVATENNILNIYNEICEKGFLNYDIELTKIKEHFEEFKAFSLEQQKEFLISMLNKNQLYKNLSEIDDKDLDVSDETKELNKSFYNISDKE